MSFGPTILGLSLLGLCACSSSYRRVELGTTPATIGKAVSATGLPVTQTRDRYQIRYHLSTPRAMQLEFAIRCPGGEETGTLGETWETYSRRRLQQLEQR